MTLPLALAGLAALIVVVAAIALAAILPRIERALEVRRLRRRHAAVWRRAHLAYAEARTHQRDWQDRQL